MESLFKFVLHRPPAQNSKRDAVIELSQSSDYQAKLATSIGNKNPRKVLKDASNQFINSHLFINQIEYLNLYPQIIAFKNRLDVLIQQNNLTTNDLNSAVMGAFGDAADTIVKTDSFKQDVANLKDSLIAIKHLPEHHKKPIETLTNTLRDLQVITKIATAADFFSKGVILKRYRKRPIRLPAQSDLSSILIQREEDRKKQQALEKQKAAEKKSTIKRQAELYNALQNAVKEIMALDDSHLESSSQTLDKGFLPPKALRPLTILSNNIQMLNTLGQLQVLNTKALSERGELLGNSLDAGNHINQSSLSVQPEKTALISGTTEFQPITNLASQFRFVAGTEQLLSNATQALLDERKLIITTMDIDQVVTYLKDEMQDLASELALLMQTQQTRSIKKVGNTMVVIKQPMALMSGYAQHASFTWLDETLFQDNRVSDSKGDILPAGIGDLLVVKQQLKGYVGRDVAHIENILKGELKARNHRRFNQTIGETYTESDTLKTEERELESTDRFELSRETSKTIKVDAAAKAGLSVSGAYGPAVSFSASAEGSVNASKSAATNTAANFSKDVTQRSLESLTERIIETNRVIITTEIEEANNHTLDNTNGGAHIAGIYQWVDKLYEARMYNYGVRTLYDFMIPEPGAFIVEAMQKSHANVMEIEKPTPFTLLPSQIFDSNYHYWTHEYGAAGINPPPEEYITKSIDYNAGGGNDNTDYNHSGIIQIDDGYRAIQASVGNVVNIWDDSWTLDVVIGRRTHRFVYGDSWVWTTNLNHETESIPFGMNTYQVADIAVAVEIKCQRTSRAYKKWQLETHGKLTEAYQAKLADYEEKLAALELQAGIEVEGKNPDLNLSIMKDELKKHCITLLTEQHFDLFNAIETGTNGLPQINLHENEAEGPYVRFFEQAFEWEHITWVTYPYYWGGKHKWEERIAYEDPDPLFNDFIKAGYCRAVVPARPGFEGAIDHFMTFGEIWNGGPLPAISTDLYLPIADELAERLDMPDDEVPQGDPWEVRVPTNLVKLRSDDQLPTWVKNADGEWVEE